MLTVTALNQTSLGSVFIDVKKVTAMLPLDGGCEFFAARNFVPWFLLGTPGAGVN